MPGSSMQRAGQGDRFSTSTRAVVTGLVVLSLVAIGFALAAGAATATSGATAVDANGPTIDTQTVADSPTADSHENESVDTPYVVEVDRTKGEADATVEVPIRAKTLIDDDDASVTGYEVGVEFDTGKLLYKSADSPVAADELEVELDPDDPGRVDLVFDSSVWDNIIDEIIGIIGGEDPFPTMNTTVARIEFHVVGDVNETADINLVGEDSTLYHGLTDWWGDYDDDEVTWTGGHVDIVEEIEEDGPTVGVPEYEVEAENTGGYVAISEDPDDTDNAEAEGEQFPSCEDGEDCIKLDALTYDTGYWESTSVTFPTLVADGGVEVDVVTPDGMWGTIDRENGSMTARGELRAIVDGDPDNDFYFTINATTGNSGAMSGSATNLDEPHATARLVDNEFVVADSTGTVVDPGLGIPNENPGENYLELPLELSFEEADEGAMPGTVDIFVDDAGGDPIEDATVNFDGGPEGLTDESGTVTFETNPGEYDVTISKSGYDSVTTTVTVEPDGHTEASTTLELGEPYFNVTAFGDEVRAGQIATPSVAVTNEGGPGEQTITLEIESTGESTTETVSLGPNEHQSVGLEWETEEGDEGTYTVVGTSEDETSEADLEVDEPLGDDDSEIVALFSATSTIGGWISFDEDNEVEAIEEGLEIPPENASDDREIRIEGEIYDDGTWESTGVDFPTLYHDGIEAEVNVPGGMAGLIDPEDEYMSGEGTLEVVLPEGDPFAFNVNLDTGTSGVLSGDASFDGMSVEATLVDNEYTINDQTGEGFLDDALGLPATTVGDQWLELVLEIDIDDDVDLARGTVVGLVETEAGEPLDGVTVDVEDAVADATTDEHGIYELEIDEGTYTLVVDADGYDSAEATVDVVEDEITEQNFVLESGDAFFAVDISGDHVPEGEVANVAVSVENIGDSPAEQDVAIAFAEEATEQTVALDSGEEFTNEFDWPTEEGDAGEYTVRIESEDDEAEATVVVEEEHEPVDGIDAVFTAASTGGYVATDEQTREDAIEEGIEFPAKGVDDDHIVISGEIKDDQWYATTVYFPPIETDAGVEAEVEAPGGLEGTIDPEGGIFTAKGQLVVHLDEYNFGFDLDLTAGDSGALSGSIAPGELVLVDNEFIVEDQTGSTVLDSELGLPALDPGLNWIELELAMEIDEIEDPDDVDTPGTVTGAVTDEAGEPIDGATVDAQGAVETDRTDASGGYELELAPGEYELSADADGYEPATVSVTVEADETVERDIALTAGTPDLELAVSADALDEETVLVEGGVENVGTGHAEAVATLSLGENEDSNPVELGPGESAQFEIEWTVEEDIADLEAILIVGDEVVSTGVTPPSDDDSDDGEIPGEDAATVFRATGQGGFIAISQDTLELAKEEGLAFPAEGINESYIVMTGVIHDDGTWESDEVSFPTLQVSDNLAASVESPTGLSGEVDRETGEMTAQGELLVEVIDSSTGEPADAEPVTFEVDLTTGESGVLSGEGDLSGESGSVTLVSNEYVIDDTTDNVFIDGDLELPATDPARNWVQLKFDVEIDESGSTDDLDADDGGQAASGDDSEDDQEEGESDNGTFLSAFGQLVGLVGVLAGLAIVGAGLVTRFFAAVDPDPDH